MDLNAKWIMPSRTLEGETAPVYRKRFASGPVKKAILRVTALGVYRAELNGKRVGDFILAPGFTAYRSRLQVQEYDVTDLIASDNELSITVGKGWYHSWFLMKLWAVPEWRKELMNRPLAAIAELSITDENGCETVVPTDESWEWGESAVRASSLYGGEVYDATWTPVFQPVSVYGETEKRFTDASGRIAVCKRPSDALIKQEGPYVREQERIEPVAVFTTPKGETVLDFGQNLAGTLAVTVNAKAGETVDVSFGEVLDADGNFFNANYRDAECRYHYVCRDGDQTFQPEFTFYGFRYVRVNEFPGGAADALEPPVKTLKRAFISVVLHSDMKQTGRIETSDKTLNRLFQNSVWSQKGNFIDIPTDCPQRDERAGWTGDAQVFAKTACLHFDTEQFFKKWLADLKADQTDDGFMPSVIPDVRYRRFSSPAWGDAATIVPWEVYLAYGDKDVLEAQFDSMKKWVDFITKDTLVPDLWIDELKEGERHYGDWVALDAPAGSYKGSTRDAFIGSAFYARSTELVVKAGKIIGKDVSAYEALYDRIVKKFRETFTDYRTQTECILAAHFRLANDPQKAADQLAEMVEASGMKLITGFIGTPYILHVLSDYGHADLAWSLLLRKEYPSWLYQVTKGATTVWEHLDGIKPDGTMWSTDMNSFNHYAYGSVMDWVYTKAAGIQTVEEAPGYGKVRIAPQPDERLGWLDVSLDTRHGKVRSAWKKEDNAWRFEITVPVEAELVIAGEKRTVPPGTYTFARN